MEAPVINVGIMSEKAVSFVFNGEYVHTESGDFLTGEQRAINVNGNIVYNGKLSRELFFEPAAKEACFDLNAVTIGVDFHWQRREDQRFRGALNLVARDNAIVVINQIDIEEYLTSVISSEMSATASAEFLKAHAVISRSWLLAQLAKNQSSPTNGEASSLSMRRTADELVRWYDREDHDMFDVCADDHCQRYQGVARTSASLAAQAIAQTRGEVATYGGTICDTRFYKCCGGVTETFEHVWEPTPHPYLAAVRDGRAGQTSGLALDTPDLTLETEAEAWIRAWPKAFCHTRDRDILGQVLTDYDRETSDFYRWKVTYTQEKLAELIKRKSGIDFGAITDLIPLKRGTSGRIERLQIRGSKRIYTIGKELEIRRTLSESHLYSSAFVVDKEEVCRSIPGRFVFTGAGWGHGVGLCQIGAAVMGAQGYDYKQILAHYFPHTSLEKRY
ncbi:MAG: SpoIID/LytB domain-containing protein [Tannerellaceae bacterium]|jgi:peptidoglycan hydrolase-like amidase|nr:SpoIID/LytB domain-containing protein [Tannerellaceae bacterium]